MTDNILFEQRKNAIRQIIYEDNYVPLKLKEFAFFLEVPKEDREDLRQVLQALVDEGTVELTARGKYVKPSNRRAEGIFTRNQRGFGFVTVKGEPQDIFIPAEYVNGACHKDLVLVKVTKRASGGKRPEGLIEKILDRGYKTIVGLFDESRNFGFVIPDDSKFGTDIFIPKNRRHGAKANDKVVVKIKDYGDEKHKPSGEITEILGPLDDPATDVTSILRSYGLPEDFPTIVKKEVRRIPQTVDADMTVGRTDYRDLLTVTIDGEDARDLDDAITLSKNEDGQFRLGVHIADVSEYVKEGSALDDEALRRATSVYLTDRVIPMLPRELSNGICSLNEGVDRLAMSCVMTFDSKGTVLDHELTESVIQVDRRMTYTGVQAILDGKDHPEAEREDRREEIRTLCFLMKEAAAVLKERRRKRGSIDFDFPESKVVVDGKGYPIEIKPYQRTTATDLIEDFMLLANETVAEDYFWQELPFLYRVHETPDPEKIRKLDTFIHNFGYYLKTGRDQFHPKEIQKLLFSLEGEPEEPLISRLALRSMQRAKYSSLNIGHFGLSAQYYCHFTSPIRRYPDLQIHRIIKESLGGKLNSKRVSHYEAILDEVADQSSRMERLAQEAEREVIKLKKVEYMEQFLGRSFTGVISGVTSWGIYVELENTVEGMIPMNALLDDYYIFDENNYQMVGQDSGRIFSLGQPIEVTVSRTDKMTRTIDFIPTEFTDIPVEDYITDQDDLESERLLAMYRNSRKNPGRMDDQQ